MTDPQRQAALGHGRVLHEGQGQQQEGWEQVEQPVHSVVGPHVAGQLRLAVRVSAKLVVARALLQVDRRLVVVVLPASLVQLVMLSLRAAALHRRLTAVAAAHIHHIPIHICNTHAAIVRGRIPSPTPNPRAWR